MNNIEPHFSLHLRKFQTHAHKRTVEYPQLTSLDMTWWITLLSITIISKTWLDSYYSITITMSDASVEIHSFVTTAETFTERNHHGKSSSFHMRSFDRDQIPLGDYFPRNCYFVKKKKKKLPQKKFSTDHPNLGLFMSRVNWYLSYPSFYYRLFISFSFRLSDKKLIQ